MAAKSVPPFWKILSKLFSLHQNKMLTTVPWWTQEFPQEVSEVLGCSFLSFMLSALLPLPMCRHTFYLARIKTCCLQGDLVLICLALQSVIKQFLARASYRLVVFLTCCLYFPQRIKLLYSTRAVASSELRLLN